MFKNNINTELLGIIDSEEARAMKEFITKTEDNHLSLGHSSFDNITIYQLFLIRYYYFSL